MTVHLVGAGPGDPGLLTVRALDVLQRADVVVYDRLSQESLLDLAPPGAERIDVGKAPGHVRLGQDDINDLLVERGRTGARVVRLKGGDPFVFARGGEEAAALAAAGVPFEVVPGITSAIAAPAYAGIPVTLRHSSTSVTIVTGHEEPGAGDDGTVDWGAVARVGGTIVVLMGVARIGRIADALMAGGRSPETPVAAVQWGTRPEQRTVRATLATIGAADLGTPSTIVVGDVAACDLAWFENRPLFGRRVVVTRARQQAERAHRAAGRPGRGDGRGPRDRHHRSGRRGGGAGGRGRAAGCGRLRVGRGHLAERSAAAAGGVGGRRARRPGARRGAPRRHRPRHRRRAGAGPPRARPGPRAVRRRVAARRVPRRRGPTGAVCSWPGPRWRATCCPTAWRPRGGRSTSSRPIAPRRSPLDDGARAALADAEIVTFTSSSTVTNFLAAAGPEAVPPVVAAIGPVTAATAREHGLTVDVEAEVHTIDGLVDALCAWVADHPRPA